MTKYGYPYLSNYCDDLIYCGLPSKIDSAYQFLLNLLQELGLDISDKKLHPPDTKVVCLGIFLILSIGPFPYLLKNYRTYSEYVLNGRLKEVVPKISYSPCWVPCYISLNVYVLLGFF